MACLHESLQLSDERRVIYCPDCGREFGHLMRDDDQLETFVVYVPSVGKVIAILEGEADDDDTTVAGLGLSPVFPGGDRAGGVIGTQIYPCRKCAWQGSCPEEGEECHS